MLNIDNNYTKEFQVKALNTIMKHNGMFATVADILEPEFFEDDTCRAYYECMLSHFKEYNEPPTPEILNHKIVERKKSGKISQADVELFIEMWDHLWDILTPGETKYIQDQILNFCSIQASKVYILQAAEGIRVANHSKIKEGLDGIQKALDIKASTHDLGVDYITNMDARLAEKENLFEERLVTSVGVRSVDQSMHRGRELYGAFPGEFGMVIGRTGVGKSKFLVNLAATNVLNGFNVLYYTLEMTQGQIEDRFDSWFSSLSPDEIINNPELFRTKMVPWKDKIKDKLRIKYFKPRVTTVAHLRSHMASLQRQEGFFPHVVCVDYLTLMGSGAKNLDWWEALIIISQDLLGWFASEEVAGWTVTHPNRQGGDDPNPSLEKVGKSYGMLEAPHFILFMTQVGEDKLNDAVRYFWLKRRGLSDKSTNNTSCYSKVSPYCYHMDV